MRPLLAPLTVLAVLLVPAAAQAADLPLEQQGVRAQNTSNGVKIVFGPKAKGLYKKIAGRKVTIECATVPPTDGPVLGRDSENDGLSASLVAPKQRRPLRLGERGRTRYDTCEVQARRTKKRKGGSEEVRIVLDLALPLTQRGAVFLDEREVATVLEFALALFAPRKGQTNYRTTDEVRGRIDQAFVLEDPSGTPPPRFVGLYSDGVQHAAVVAVTASGRRVFIDVNGDALTSNLSTVLFR